MLFKPFKQFRVSVWYITYYFTATDTPRYYFTANTFLFMYSSRVQSTNCCKVIRLTLFLVVYSPGNRILFNAMTCNTIQKVVIQRWKHFKYVWVDPSSYFISNYIEVKPWKDYTLYIKYWILYKNLLGPFRLYPV